MVAEGSIFKGRERARTWIGEISLVTCGLVGDVFGGFVDVVHGGV